MLTVPIEVLSWW